MINGIWAITIVIMFEHHGLEIIHFTIFLVKIFESDPCIFWIFAKQCNNE